MRRKERRFACPFVAGVDEVEPAGEVVRRFADALRQAGVSSAG